MSAGSGGKIVLTAHGASERGIEVVPEGTKEKKGSKRYDEERGEADDDSTPDTANPDLGLSPAQNSTSKRHNVYPILRRYMLY